jgi:hypothetical protein
MLVAMPVAYQTVFAARKKWDDLDGKTRRPASTTLPALASDSPVVKRTGRRSLQENDLTRLSQAARRGALIIEQLPRHSFS